MTCRLVIYTPGPRFTVANKDLECRGFPTKNVYIKNYKRCKNPYWVKGISKTWCYYSSNFRLTGEDGRFENVVLCSSS